MEGNGEEGRDKREINSEAVSLTCKKGRKEANVDGWEGRKS